MGGAARAANACPAGNQDRNQTNMCGITGYIGERSAWEMVLGGLKRLEYRGYDSAGIVTVADGEMRIARRVGHIRALEEATPKGLPGQVGIGHTRWATHGGVTEAN